MVCFWIIIINFIHPSLEKKTLINRLLSCWEKKKKVQHVHKSSKVVSNYPSFCQTHVTYCTNKYNRAVNTVNEVAPNWQSRRWGLYPEHTIWFSGLVVLREQQCSLSSPFWNAVRFGDAGLPGKATSQPQGMDMLQSALCCLLTQSTDILIANNQGRANSLLIDNADFSSPTIMDYNGVCFNTPPLFNIV